MSLFAMSGIWITITAVIVILFLIRYGNSAIHRTWALFNTAVCVWGASSIVIGTTLDRELSLAVTKVGDTGVIFIAVFFYHFVHDLCENRDKRVLYLVYLQAGIFTLLLYPGLLYRDFTIVFGQFYYPIANAGFQLLFAIWMSIVGYGHFLLFQLYRRSSGLRKLQVSYLFLGMIVGFSGGASNFFPCFNLHIYPYGNFTISLYCLIVAYAILRYQLLDMRVVVTRVGIFLSLYLFVLGIPFYVGHVTGSWKYSTPFAVIFATMGPILYRSLQNKVENIILSEQRRYQKILLQAANGMMREHDLNRLLKLIVYIVTKTVRINYAGAYLLDKEKKLFRLSVVRGIEVSERETDIPADHPLISCIMKKQEPFLYDELPASVRAAVPLPFPVVLIVPARYDDRVLGFLLLGEKTNRKAYSPDDRNVFGILSRQAALSIENCVFLKEFQKTQERVFAAEKLASIGGLAEGIAHQINNRLNHFAMIAGEMRFEIEDCRKKHVDVITSSPDLAKSLNYFNEMSEGLMSNVRRTENVVKGILQYARVEAKETLYSAFFLQEVVDLSVDLLCIKHNLKTLSIEVIKKPADIIYGIKAQIMEAVFNILDNAYEAVQDRVRLMKEEDAEKFTPKITLTITQTPASAILQFDDNGIGIKEENYHKVFAPFFTTKSSYKSGTGIGMYVVKRMVEENHGGKIWFTSTYGSGTSIFIELPKKAPKPEAGEQA